MRKVFFSVFLLLIFSLATGYTLSGVTEASETKEVLSARSDLERLYKELLSFKNGQRFRDFGFAVANRQAHAWQNEVTRKRDDIQSKRNEYPPLLSTAFGDLLQLGMHYLRTKGSEDDYTRFVRVEIEKQFSSATRTSRSLETPASKSVEQEPPPEPEKVTIPSDDGSTSKSAWVEDNVLIITRGQEIARVVYPTKEQAESALRSLMLPREKF